VYSQSSKNSPVRASFKSAAAYELASDCYKQKAAEAKTSGSTLKMVITVPADQSSHPSSLSRPYEVGDEFTQPIETYRQRPKPSELVHSAKGCESVTLDSI